MSSAYIIANERLNLRITLLEISALLVHEETIAELLEQLTQRNDEKSPSEDSSETFTARKFVGRETV